MDFDNYYGTLETQKVLLNLLREFDVFCDKHNVIYSLDSGSLLGAIRHNGFIPWDDDVDIVMTRENRDRLLESIDDTVHFIVSKEIWVDRIQYRLDNKDGYRPTIDIFILDNAPDSILLRKIKVLIIACLQGMIKGKPDYKKFSFANRFFSFVTYNLGKLFSLDVKLKWYDHISSLENNRNTKYGSCYNYMFKELGVLYHADSLDIIVRHQFETLMLPITYDYDYYLTALYGNYMTPPKQEDRKPVHL